MHTQAVAAEKRRVEVTESVVSIPTYGPLGRDPWPNVFFKSQWYAPFYPLDRYLHRKGQSYLSWVHLTTLLFMLVTLVLIFIYKDRCGQFISNFVFMGTSKSESPPAVHYLENAPTPAVRGNDRGADH